LLAGIFEIAPLWFHGAGPDDYEFYFRSHVPDLTWCAEPAELVGVCAQISRGFKFGHGLSAQKRYWPRIAQNTYLLKYYNWLYVILGGLMKAKIRNEMIEGITFFDSLSRYFIGDYSVEGHDDSVALARKGGSG
jgi:hypothetical protein